MKKSLDIVIYLSYIPVWNG